MIDRGVRELFAAAPVGDGFNDWSHGKCGVAVEWWDDTRVHDYDPKEKEYRHVLWAAYPGGVTEDFPGAEGEAPPPPTG